MMLANRIFTMTTKHQYMIAANKLKKRYTAQAHANVNKDTNNYYNAQWKKNKCNVIAELNIYIIIPIVRSG